MMYQRALFTWSLVLTMFIIAGCGGGQSDKSKTPEPAAKGGAAKVFTIISSGFKDGDSIPLKYANTVVSGAENLSPPLVWSDAPAGTNSFALVVVDRSPVADDWLHWVVIDLPANTTSLLEGASGSDKMPAGSKELNNTFGLKGYNGPQPPPGSGPHDYELIIYALNIENLTMDQNVTFADFFNKLQSYVLSSAKMTVRMER